ncbi:MULTISPECIES: hypothetical protein [Corynebacterium]|uniref:hypothetical protein n=1 Tax=Corynebacterium TaxID=1716 RepID=UPI001EDC4A30|nr:MULTISPECIES: hypothetical protein [Corynebacterium]MCG7232897.1 hypothetical protein [Corynebacterium sp. ACRPR]MCG7242743.1 hypothetical protein [Corynebacterium sp. ACRPS]MCG7270528.1 hypothetical protein [Corynebacterium sp. ACRQM]MDK4208288.1 hypothetical protein [Corynebacterium accolens]MDK4232959.1 hypothetical protein [Corynebacterium accolens]
MQPKIIDVDTGDELWTGSDCAAHIGVSYATWRNYSANHRTPEHVATILGRTRLWLAEDIKRWHASRPGSPSQLRR